VAYIVPAGHVTYTWCVTLVMYIWLVCISCDVYIVGVYPLIDSSVVPCGVYIVDVYTL